MTEPARAYHHGGLRAALLDEAYALIRQTTQTVLDGMRARRR
jgi:hypothetical protein